MNPWLRCESVGWERARVELRAAGVVLPRDLAVLDLRWLDQRGSIPSRSRLMERWGWTDKRVRLLLRTESAWRDPLNIEGPTKGQNGANEGPTRGQTAPVETPTIPETGPTKGQRRAKMGPAEVHTRGEVQLQTIPVHHENMSSTSDWDVVAAAWATASPSSRPLVQRRGQGKAVHARLVEHGVGPVVDVMRWFASSRDKRATFLRENGYGLDTLMRPDKFEGYATLAGRPTAPLPAAWVGVVDDDEPAVGAGMTDEQWRDLIAADPETWANHLQCPPHLRGAK